MTDKPYPARRVKPADQDLWAYVRALEARIRALEDRLRKRRDMPDGFDDHVDPEPLIDARKAAGWSQRDVALGLGVSANMICFWERRRCKLTGTRARQIQAMFRDNGAEPPAFVFPTPPVDDNDAI